jgi:hypothetical protein
LRFEYTKPKLTETTCKLANPIKLFIISLVPLYHVGLILDLNNITKFLMQWRNKKNCSILVKSIHLPINNTSQLQNQKHHIKPITKIQRLNKFNNKTKEPTIGKDYARPFYSCLL